MTEAGGDLGAWLRAANPFTATQGDAEARRAARIGAISAALMAAQSVVGALLVYLHPERMAAVMHASMASAYRTSTVDPAMADTVTNGMIQWMPTFILVVSAVFAIVELILAVVQWRRPNVVIPAILLALVAFGLLSTLSAHMRQPQLAAGASSPGMLAYAVVSNLIHIVLLTAALRGALALDRFRRAGLGAA